MLNIAVLMPTYGRPTLLANAVACFEAQTYPDAHRRLIVLDDGNHTEGAGVGWKICHHPEGKRYPNLMAKYVAMMELLEQWWPRWDAVALQDDDDVYGPDWIAGHAAALDTGALWSYPATVASLYGRKVLEGDTCLEEPSGGRFWASACVGRALLEQCGGFQVITRPTFDQEHLGQWHSMGGQPGRPDATHGIQYVYGWGRANHVSLQMPDRERWYENHTKREAHTVPRLVPKADAITCHLYRVRWGVSFTAADLLAIPGAGAPRYVPA